VSLHRTPIDVDAAVDALIEESSYPQRQAWADEYLRASNSDADAIAAYTHPRQTDPNTIPLFKSVPIADLLSVLGFECSSQHLLW